MKLPNQSTGSGFEKCPAGNHLAVCYEVIDLGTQPNKFDDGPKTKHEIWIGWETPMELMDDGRPYVIGRRYTLSSSEKSTLRKHLESWRGKSFSEEDFGNFDILSIVGKCCFLSVVHSEKGEKTYANIQAVAALPKGTPVPKQINETVTLDLTPEDFNINVYESLSEYMKGLIAQSPEYESLDIDRKAKTTAIDESDDRTPF